MSVAHTVLGVVLYLLLKVDISAYPADFAAFLLPSSDIF